MKRINLILLSVLALWQMPVEAQPEIKTVSGVYVGGHIRRERPKTITTLRESGFTYVLLFNVHVDPDGTLKTDGEVICKDGEYVFAKPQPNYQMDIRNLKTPPTSIQRIDIVIGGWGNNSYDNIKNLINTKGTGANTMLYKNFKALKEAVPEIDGVNNDDEQCYDLETGAKFHIMMYNLGYKTTLAPYTNKSYWQNLCTKIRASKPDAVDRVMVQCYDGGAGNVNRVGTATGGFVWVYNDEGTWFPKNSTQEDLLNTWASGMNRVFKAVEVPEEDAMVEVFSGPSYSGYSVKLPAGTFSKADLAVYGLKGNDLESIKILKEGASARLYKTTNNAGTLTTSLLCKASKKTLSASYKNTINSITVTYEDPVGLSRTESEKNDGEVTVYTLDGKFLGHGKSAIRKAAKGETVIVKTGTKSIKIKN